MSILFVLLTFLLILTVMYFRRPQQVEVGVYDVPAKRASTPLALNHTPFNVPEGYSFHPGHTWVVDEGRQNARVGIDSFAANLVGAADSIDIADINRWVRQGQPICTITHNDRSVDFLSPVEGVLVSVNPALSRTPNVAVDDPYCEGWLCVIKAPEIATNMKNLLQGPITAPWMQNSVARLGAMVQPLTPALAQDGGLPVKGLLFQVEPAVQQQLAKEFFLN